ncbi:F0F1 ATP synthase subunit delta [Lederbergia sp. NSJ-179]|uniref:F0F1 ATP synthase subunit delta n=1 Tax=Lederbergia sp. NSJ-179 TaxID=2931402 RepID=UPI001FCFADA7|nr:F0F1 ATP synthase subunit delta [Lederbergia sp. NSJ-179]MCJ7840575.1 F0F1 ATP synthase subunit delta [Lederbergia sp. NSJ-179]
MSRNVVAERYALALYKIAKEQNQVNKWEEELRVVRRSVKDNPDLLSLFSSPNLTILQKKNVAKEVFAKLSPTVVNTILLLIDKNRHNHLVDVANAFIDYANQDNGVAEATVYSVRALTASETEAISATFAAKVGRRSLNIENIVDSDLLGGIKVQIGNRIFDGSLRGQLDRLARTLTT